MDPLERRMIVIVNADNGFIIALYEGMSGSPAVKTLVAKHWGEVVAIVQSLDLAGHTDDILNDAFGKMGVDGHFRRPETT